MPIPAISYKEIKNCRVTVFYTALLTILIMAAFLYIQNSYFKDTTSGKINNSITKCTSKEPLIISNISIGPELSSLSNFQKVCDSFVADRHMVFIGIPTSIEEAEQDAARISATLKDFAKAGVTPVVIAEPFYNGEIIDMKKLIAGGYDDVLNSFFWNIKETGLTSEEMGIWVPFPEANTPSMDYPGREPRDFSLAVNTYARIMHDFFAKGHVSILLDSKSYDPGDADWETGAYRSHNPYISDIVPGSVSSIGIQGFPWKPENESKTIGELNARDFLQTQFLVEATSILNIYEVWYNTGTFYGTHLESDEVAVYLTAEERANIHEEILAEIAYLQNKRLSVWINIFAEDKTDSYEATNWSYWGDDIDESHTDSFKTFISKLSDANIPLSLFGGK